MTRPVVQLPDQLRQQIVEHCQAELPNEACGLLAIDGDQIVRVYSTRNVEASPSTYRIDPQEHYEALVDAESRGWTIGGVYHSHPTGDAQMSDIDRVTAQEPDWVYVVVGMKGRLPVVSTHTL